jgi:NAD(P)-dependent dehydrogenase (short-subunit alcohol dehydrogenase family)
MTADQLFNLEQKTALITGASSGLGKRFVQCLSQAGARVILVARRLDEITQLASELGNAKALSMDIAHKNSVQQVFSTLEQDSEKIDICINSAGIAMPTPIFEPDDQEHFFANMQTNVMGSWYITHAVANHMQQHNIPGSIIHIASVNGANKLREQFTGYCASKAAVIQMIKALVGELSAANIRINCIAPGLFHTPLTNYKLNTKTAKTAMANTIPLKFVAEPKDLDGAILYLASNELSRYVTGTCLTVDGGVSWGG